MDLLWGDEKTVQFITNVGLITTNGPNGDNIMSCEWTHQVSYSPGMIVVCIRPSAATNENILETKQFGVSLAALDQATLASISGMNKGREIDKIKVLQELGFKFYKAKEIDTLMVEGAALNIECRLKQVVELNGTHTMFIGEIINVIKSGDKKPLAYHKGQFGEVKFDLAKPSEQEKNRIAEIIIKYKK